MVSGLGLFLALALTPLSLVAAILQMLPLVVTLGAALFLAERVGPHRIGSVLVGFAGVMLIIRPGSADFDIGSLFAVLAVLGMALRDIVDPQDCPPGRPAACLLTPAEFLFLAWALGDRGWDAGLLWRGRDTAILGQPVTGRDGGLRLYRLFHGHPCNPHC